MSKNSDWPSQSKKDRKQRGERGWSDSDTWNVDTYISGVLAGMLTRLRERNCGHPSSLTKAEWNQILDDMAAGFSRWEHRWENDDYDKAERKVQKSIRLFGQWLDYLWD